MADPNRHLVHKTQVPRNYGIPMEEGKYYVCDVCKIRFGELHDARTHMINVHPVPVSFCLFSLFIT